MPYTSEEALDDSASTMRITRSKARSLDRNEEDSSDKLNKDNSNTMGNRASVKYPTPESEILSSVPASVPSIIELKKSLPSHCFTPSMGRSFCYVAKDLAIMAMLYSSVVVAEAWAPTVLLFYLYLPLYWYLQGTMMWAVFVLGHDCGHSSFSNSTLVNDITGNLLHGLILVPYYPWKVSHQHHHKNTGNIDKDEIFYPVRAKDSGSYKDGGKRFIPLFGFGLSWFFYLFKGYSPRAANHLNPRDPLFVRHSVNCTISIACCISWIVFALVPYAAAFGAIKLAMHYGVPVFVFASWLVVTTFLHHQDEHVPWYSDSKWDFVRGQLSSVDRHYGWAHELVHNIGTHQIHHLFSKIPHYHLEEATRAFRQKYPQLVRKSDAPILPAFVKMFNIFDAQQWVEDDAEVHTYNGKRIKAE